MSVKRIIGLAAATAAGGFAADASFAEPWILSGVATVRAGVDSNPYLQAGSQSASGVAGASISGNARRTAPKSVTTMFGSADISQSFSRYGRNTNFLAGIARTQTFTPHLVGSGQVTYTSTLSPQANFAFAPTQGLDTNPIATVPLDYLTIGTRSQRIDGSGALDWQATANDTLRVGAFGSHSTYNSAIASTTDQYGGSFGYLRRIDARTQVGINLQASNITSNNYPSSQSYQAFVQVVRQLNPIWTFDGSFGPIRQHSGGRSAVNRTTFGFNGSLCANYPRLSGCLTFSRQAAPSGIGGLRTDTQASLNVDYRLTERSRVSVMAVIDDSSSRDIVLIPRQRFYSLGTTYSRQLTDRISVGGSARYQRRSTGGSAVFGRGTPENYSLTANVSYAFGQIGQ